MKEGGEDRAAYRRAPGEGDKERGNYNPQTSTSRMFKALLQRRCRAIMAGAGLPVILTL